METTLLRTLFFETGAPELYVLYQRSVGNAPETE